MSEATAGPRPNGRGFVIGGRYAVLHGGEEIARGRLIECEITGPPIERYVTVELHNGSEITTNPYRIRRLADE